MVSPLLPIETHELFHQTLVTLNDCAKMRIVAEVENKHKAFYDSAAEYSTGNANDIDSKFEILNSNTVIENGLHSPRLVQQAAELGMGLCHPGL